MWLDAILVELLGDGTTVDSFRAGRDGFDRSIKAIQFFISGVKLSGILGLATIYKKTKN